MAGHKQMSIQQLTCFKACYVRGELNMNLEADIAYLNWHAAAQKFQAKKIVVVKRFTRYAIKAVVSLKYVKVLQVMKCLRVISTDGSNRKIISYCAFKDW